MRDKNAPVKPFYKEFSFIAEKDSSLSGYTIQLHVVYDNYTDVFLHEGYCGLPRETAGYIRGLLNGQTTHLSEDLFDNWTYLETFINPMPTKEVFYGRQAYI